jgi:hypothetical protein
VLWTIEDEILAECDELHRAKRRARVKSKEKSADKNLNSQDSGFEGKVIQII